MENFKSLTKGWKRLLIVALAMIMVVSAAACANTSTTTSGQSGQTTTAGTSTTEGTTAGSEAITLEYWDAWPGDPQKTILDEIVAEWNAENPDIQVNRSTTANDPYKTKIKTAIAGDEAPDVFFSWPQGFTKPFVDAGKVLPIDDYLTEEIKAQILPGAMVEFDGVTYGVCATQQVGTFFVNTAILEENGLTVPATFEELVDAAKVLKAKDIVTLAVGQKDLWPGMWYFDQIALRMAGPELVVKALNKEASYDSEPFIKAAAKLQELVEVGAFDPNVLGISRDESEVAFFSGKAAMYYGLNASAGRIKGSEVDGKIEVHPFPAIADGADKTSYVGGGAVTFLASNNTKHPEAAAKLALYLSQATSDQLFLTGNALPMWDYSKFDQSQLDPVQLEIMDKIALPAEGNVSAWDIFLQGEDAQTHKDLVAEIFGSNITPEDFAKNMQSSLNG